MVRSSRIDMVTYPRMNQKLDIIIMKLKRAARGALIKKKRMQKEVETGARDVMKIFIYSFYAVTSSSAKFRRVKKIT